MKKISKGCCKSASHKLFKDKAKNHVDDMQMMFLDLQFARKESRTVDAALLEEQVHQMLREWKAELNEPSPASSLQQVSSVPSDLDHLLCATRVVPVGPSDQEIEVSVDQTVHIGTTRAARNKKSVSCSFTGGSLGSFSTDICRLLQRCEEEDDATSPLAVPKSEPNDQTMEVDAKVIFKEDLHQHDFLLIDECKDSTLGVSNIEANSMDGRPALESERRRFDLNKNFNHSFYAGFNSTGFCKEDGVPGISSYLPSLFPPPSAFLGPKCALWDCSRPVQGLDWCQDYCSSFHAALALNEGPPGMVPVVRPGGIGLKDNLLFAALSAKAEGKDVGIPKCEGAATAKSPWNAPEFFDLCVLEGETIREWLFFDKPRRAFESGNRKQRSLPDYSGRGWHESRKQVMNEFKGLKRSYYMDPQPLNHFEWHLYEYEISKCDACALYRLELKLVDGKKSSKSNIINDSVTVMQKRIGRFSAEFPYDNNKRSSKGRAKLNAKRVIVSPLNGPYEYELAAPYDYLVESTRDYYVK